jgi:hypothetical protein
MLQRHVIGKADVQDSRDASGHWSKLDPDKMPTRLTRLLHWGLIRGVSSNDSRPYKAIAIEGTKYDQIKTVDSIRRIGSSADRESEVLRCPGQRHLSDQVPRLRRI